MQTFDKGYCEVKFSEGLTFLETKKYEKADDIFTMLIKLSSTTKGSEDSKLIRRASLVNRGVARCNLGLRRGDKALFSEGLEDFSVCINDSDMVRPLFPLLTADRNLKSGLQLLKSFGKPGDAVVDTVFDVCFI